MTWNRYDTVKWITVLTKNICFSFKDFSFYVWNKNVNFPNIYQHCEPRNIKEIYFLFGLRYSKTCLSMVCKFAFQSLHTIISVIKQQTWHKHIIADSNVTLYWCHHKKFSINILLLICFAQKGLLIAPQTWYLMWYCSEKSILVEQINDSIYLLYCN